MRRWIVVLVVLVSMGVLAWLAVRATDPGDPNQTSDPIRVTAGIERMTLEDTVILRGVTGYQPTTRLTAGAPGRVTDVAVVAGDVVEPGAVLLAIDGRPVVAVAAEMPFWRDLSMGAAGSDVRQLQAVLSQAGHDVEESGTFDEATGRALQAWQAEHGLSPPDGTLALNDLATGSWPQRVGQVRVQPGDLVSPGDQLIDFTGREPVVNVELLPSDRLRVAVDDPARVELSATGAQAAGKLSEVSASPITREDDGSLLYTARVTLDEPLEAPEGTQAQVVIVIDRVEDVLAVPLAAVVSDDVGRPAVRVVGGDGSTRLVPVELGVSQGAWVQVVEGLEGTETVVVVER